MNKGILHGILAYALWGLFPIFWKQLSEVEAFQIIGHRIIWSFAILFGVSVFIQRKSLKEMIPSFPNLKIYTAASILIGINWFLYVWAVNSGHIVESSLGYFINPLLSVLFGILFFKERLRTGQILPLILATTGVLYLSFALDSVPWIALSLAFSFGLYGVVKKLAPLHPIQGLTLETGILVLPALIFLIQRQVIGEGAFLHIDIRTNFLLIAAGIITTLPLLFFASAARKIPMSMLGFLQYLSPSLQFLCGILIYKEAFAREQFIGYGLVWLSLAIFALEGFREKVKNDRLRAA